MIHYFVTMVKYAMIIAGDVKMIPARKKRESIVLPVVLVKLYEQTKW